MMPRSSWRTSPGLDGDLIPEGGGLDLLDGLGLVAHRVEVHQQLADLVQQGNPVVVEPPGAAQQLDLHAGKQQVELVGIRIAANVTHCISGAISLERRTVTGSHW